ncbi:MAG: tyrosine--tRNA ligase [Minisyncoccia bacterium]
MIFSKKASQVNVDPQAVEEFLGRSLENIYPNRDYLKAQMLSGKQLSIYLGIDPTGPTLHLGHAVQLKKLRDFQKLGHKVILLIGDFTGMIGDPTDKSATRKPLTREDVLKNCKLYKKQASLFLNFSGRNPAEFKFNSKWLAKMTFSDVVKVASNFTVQQMLERDMFQKRMKEAKPIHLHEFLYPLMQGYDSVILDVDGEIGGNDQTFNMLAGRNLMKDLKNKEKFVITTKLLADNSGIKMGKTEGNMVSFLDDYSEKFGKIMSWTDGMIVPGLELCTDVPITEIKKIETDLASGQINPKDYKVRLAKEIVTIYHNKELAFKAETNFNETFKKGGVPEEIEEATVTKGETLVNVLLNNKIISSKSDFRRLITEGAVSDMSSEEKIKDLDYKIEGDITVKVGKRRFLKIRVK